LPGAVPAAAAAESVGSNDHPHPLESKPRTLMSSFGIGFLEEFLLLLISGSFLGVCVFYTLRFLALWIRGRVGVLHASGPLFLLAIFFFYVNIPRIFAAVTEGFPYFVAMAGVAALVMTWGVNRRGAVSRGASGVVFLLAASSLLTFSIFQFVTAHHTPFRGEELVALVEVSETQLPPNFDASTEDYTLVYKKGVKGVDLELHYFDEGKPAPPIAYTLPGEKWGVGGYLMQVHNWLFLFGNRTFYRLTTVDAKFRDNEMAHYGRNLPGYDPNDTRTRLEEQIPLFNRKLGEICDVETRKIEYEDVVYQPVSAGRYWGIYIRPGGGFVPKRLEADEYRELRKRFVEPVDLL
jgi:hypothetical protein